MDGVFCAAFFSLMVGYSVYRSCTRYKSIMPAALCIDAIGTAVVLAIFYAAGIFK